MYLFNNFIIVLFNKLVDIVVMREEGLTNEKGDAA